MLKHGKKVLVLDFDGVICDSTRECMVTAWQAWHKYRREIRGVDTDFTAPKSLQSWFSCVRPFVRGGGEYLVLLDIWAANAVPPNRDEFLSETQKNKAEQARYADFFYECREKLLGSDPEKWCGLHDEHRDVTRLMREVAGRHPIYIATLKDKASVLKLLQHYEVEFSEDLVLDRNDIVTKLEALHKIASSEAVSANSIYFVDDNPLHLLPLKNEFVNSFLSTWGPFDLEARKIALQNDLNTLNDCRPLYDIFR